jgi:putative oxidoreductase
MTLVRRFARPLLASTFVVAGLDHLRHPGATSPMAAPLVDRVAAPLGLPEDPELLVRANGAAMVGAGGLLAIGRLPRLSAAVLASTLVPTTYVGHQFWAEKDPVTRKQQRTQFLKNLSLLGGLLIAAVDTEGRPGLAYRAHLAREGAGRTARRTRREARHAVKAARREARLAASQAHDALT